MSLVADITINAIGLPAERQLTSLWSIVRDAVSG